MPILTMYVIGYSTCLRGAIQGQYGPFVYKNYMVALGVIATVYEKIQISCPYITKNNSNDFLSRTTGSIGLIFCVKHIGHLPI